MAAPKGYLLDTSVVVQLLRGKKIGKRIDAEYDLSGNLHQCAVSVVTVGEMYALARQFGWGAKKLAALAEALDKVVRIDIAYDDVLKAYGEVATSARKRGIAIGQNDLWIAATAHVSGMTLLTTDRDFAPFDPDFLKQVWTDPASDGDGGE